MKRANVPLIRIARGRVRPLLVSDTEALARAKSILAAVESLDGSPHIDLTPKQAHDVVEWHRPQQAAA